MAGRTAILAVRIISNANRRGFDATERSLANIDRRTSRVTRTMERFDRITSQAGGRLGATAAKATALAGSIGLAGGAVGSLGAGLLAVGVLAGPALGAIALGAEGIKRAFKPIGPQFDRLKSSVSGTFERELAPAVSKLGGLLDHITPAMSKIASATSGVFSGVIDQITGPGRAALDQLLAGSAKFITALGPGISQLVGGLVNLGAAAAPIADKLGSAFGGVLGTIGQQFTNLFASGALTDALSGFADLLNGVSAFLGPLIVLLVRLGAVAGPILGQAFTIFGGAITAATPALVDMTAAFGGGLIDALTALAPVVPQIAQAFADLATALAPAMGPIAGVAAAFIGGAASIVSWAASVPGLAAALLGVAIAIKLITTALALYRAGVAIATAVQTVFNAVMMINPFVLIAVAVIALIAAIVLLWQNCETFRNIVMAVCNAAVAVFRAVLGAVVAVGSWIGGQLAGALRIVGGVFSATRAIAVGAFNAIMSPIRTVVGLIQSLINWISNIHWPEPPGWLKSIGGALGFAPGDPPFMPGPGPRFGGGMSYSFAAGGAMAGPVRSGTVGATIINQIDQSTTVNVDGSVLTNAQDLSGVVQGAQRRNRKTRGGSYAVKL